MIAKDGHIYRAHPDDHESYSTAAAPAAEPDIDYPYEVEEIVSYRHNKKKRRDNEWR
eukprot:CAMPEP_0180103356 /NCGR_PEP_ID=MMETSP0985-20121206/30727_1 /TAXON_ID=483367 /ORGANISM="non described non described, Strain CCMP 2436" /LENGTH=56 /DNA_ID=CAMNT_0022039831 /DNA_START=9 /DNA_END=175 /DNA_ORIENTATION=+